MQSVEFSNVHQYFKQKIFVEIQDKGVPLLMRVSVFTRMLMEFITSNETFCLRECLVAELSVISDDNRDEVLEFIDDLRCQIIMLVQEVLEPHVAAKVADDFLCKFIGIMAIGSVTTFHQSFLSICQALKETIESALPSDVKFN